MDNEYINYQYMCIETFFNEKNNYIKQFKSKKDCLKYIKSIYNKLNYIIDPIYIKDILCGNQICNNIYIIKIIENILLYIINNNIDYIPDDLIKKNNSIKCNLDIKCIFEYLKNNHKIIISRKRKHNDKINLNNKNIIYKKTKYNTHTSIESIENKIKILNI